MTNEELVIDTINYYKTNPRAISDSGGQCEYLTNDGKMCAVGRFIDWEKVKANKVSVSYFNGNIGTLNEDNISLIQDYFKPEVKDIPLKLWEDLQHYHDFVLCDSEDKLKLQEEVLLKRWKNNKKPEYVNN